MGNYCVIEDLFGLYICRTEQLEEILIKYEKYEPAVLAVNKDREYILKLYNIDVNTVLERE